MYKGIRLLRPRNIPKIRFNATLGKRIKEARKRTNMCAKEFAAHLGVSERQLRRYEAGSTTIDVYQLARIARLCGEGIESLVADLDDLLPIPRKRRQSLLLAA